MSIKYDEVPEEWLGDTIRIWQAQITGEKNFESCSFMGCLNDLQGVLNWRDAFKGIEHCTGMAEFMDRLQGHFDLCSSAQNPDGSVHIYQHPSRTKGNSEVDINSMLTLAKRHIDTLITGFKRSEMEDMASELAKHPIVWTDQAIRYFFMDWKAQRNARNAPKELYLYAAWDFRYSEKNYWENRFRDGAPDIVGMLEESAYSLANDYGLQRYLMQSFVTHGLDVDAQYELEWVNNCMFYFYGDTCYVAKRPTK